MGIDLLQDLLIIFSLAIVVILLFFRLHIPPMIGFLLTGIVAGPHYLGLVQEVHGVEILSELGVVLLLFTIGIEFSLKRLLSLRRPVMIGGTLQVVCTIAAVYLAARQFDVTVSSSIFLGFIISLSSTAIVLKLLQEKAQIMTQFGRISLATLIFQDVVVVLMLLFTPLLADSSTNLLQVLGLLVVKFAGVLLVLFIGARWLVPWALYQVTRTRSRELFLLAILLLCAAVAGFTAKIGLSFALGAFLAGLVLAESEYGTEAFGNIMPFRDVFLSLFFVSIGMLLDWRVLTEYPVLITSMVLGVLVLKSIVATCAFIPIGFPLRPTLLAALALCQIGEFSFILSRTGKSYGLLDEHLYQIVLAVIVMTMAVTPFILMISERAAELALRLPWPDRLRSGLSSDLENEVPLLNDHLVIIGFGVNGRNVARAARASGIPYIILESNPETVRQQKASGERIVYGDATQDAVLHSAHVEHARVIVVAISDPAATARITGIVHRLNPAAHMIVRTRFVSEMQPLYDLGAEAVIPEEFETSIEIFVRVLTAFLVPADEIQQLVADVRTDGYSMFRKLSPDPITFSSLRKQLPEVEIGALRLHPRSSLAGRTIAEVDLYQQHKVLVVAVLRDGNPLPFPFNKEPLRQDDVLYVFGNRKQLASVSPLIRGVTRRPAANT